MTISDSEKVDLVAENPTEVLLIIVEDRKWGDIERPDVKVAVKINAYKRFSATKEFEEKYGKRKVRIVIESKYGIPSKIADYLKAENVEIGAEA